jgi:hypothetical protein
MAATYVEVTLEDMERFLKRAYRVFRPKQGTGRGEVYYDLNVSDEKIFIRVWTSIRPRSGSGAGVGQDAIRVTMITKGGKPLVKRQKIVKRTKNWRSAIQDRVDTLLEDYEAKADSWKGRQKERDDEAEKEKADEAKNQDSLPTPEFTNDSEHQGTFVRDRDSGAWNNTFIHSKGSPGDDVVVTNRAGNSVRGVLSERLWVGNMRGKYTERWTFEKRGGSLRYSSDAEFTKFVVEERAFLAAQGGVSDEGGTGPA